MRFVAKYIGYGIHAVIDTEAPKEVREDQEYGHAVLTTQNGGQPAEIAAKAMNEDVEKRNKKATIILTCMPEEKRDLLDKAVEAYKKFKNTEELPDNVYSGFYWLIRYSGLI